MSNPNNHPGKTMLTLLRPEVLLACALGGAAFTRVHAAVEITRFSRQPVAVEIAWTSEPGKAYSLLSAPTIAGPWAERITLAATHASLGWTNAEPADQPQRFYRVLEHAPAAVGAELLAAANLPQLLGSTALETANLGVQGVFLASILGAGGAQLVTTGTLTQQGANWDYTPTPPDRLFVQFQTGSNLTYYVTRMEGDFSRDAATFLENPHAFNYRVIVPNLGDLSFDNAIPPGTCDFLVTARGGLTLSNVTYDLDVTLSGTYCIDNSFGYQLINDYTTTGTVNAPGYALTLNQRWRHELIGGGGGGASAVQEWNNSTLTLGADTYQWDNTKKQKSFRDGRPSSLDTYWLASGNVLRNGTVYGTYRLQPEPLLARLKFVLDLPTGTIELESWNL